MTFNSEQLQVAAKEVMHEAATVLILASYLPDEKQAAHDDFFTKKTRRLRAIAAEIFKIKQGLEEIHETRLS